MRIQSYATTVAQLFAYLIVIIIIKLSVVLIASMNCGASYESSWFIWGAVEWNVGHKSKRVFVSIVGERCEHRYILQYIRKWSYLSVIIKPRCYAIIVPLLLALLLPTAINESRTYRSNNRLCSSKLMDQIT